MPSIWEDEEEYPIVQKLFKEVLGYTDEEIKQQVLDGKYPNNTFFV